MKLLILCALKSEANELLHCHKAKSIFLRKRQSLFLAEQGNTKLYFGITGVGRKNARRFLKTFSSEIGTFDALIVGGFAGALNPSYRAGDIVCAKAFLDLENNRMVSLVSGQNFLKKSDFSFQMAVGASVNGFLLKKDKQDLLTSNSSVDFVDMESLEAVLFCEEQEIPCCIVRSVSDELGFDFPPLEFVQDSWKRINLLRLLAAVLRRPAVLLKVFSFRSRLRKAGKNLARALVEVVKGFEDK
jgi:nucleoside phosphorylase